MLVSKLQFAVIVLVSFILMQNSFAQNILTHNTGTIAVSMYDNSYIGHNWSATTGSGVIFTGGPDALYTAGFVAGYSLTKTVGLVGSFTDGGVPVMQDWVTTVPFSSFSSDPNFNQIATATFNDANAPAANLIGLSVVQTSLSNTNDDYVFLHYTITNNSGSTIIGLYAGVCADWDVGLANYLLNQGGYDPARNLAYQYENGGAADTRYYGFVAFNGLAGARVTTNSAFGTGGSGPVRDSVFHWISTFLNEPITTNGDYRSFIGAGPYNLGNGESVKVGFVVVAGTNLADLQANTDAAQTKWNNVVVPVELTSFTASVNPLGQAILKWVTATEINNRAFEIERRKENSDFVLIGFVEGKGTTTERQEYTFIDKNITAGKYYYRLKQIDFDGTFEYSNEIEVDAAPVSFSLEQNYPNPFNPSTKISYSIPYKSFVSLKVYDQLGTKVAELVQEEKEAGKYEIDFKASNLSSGIYFYKIQAGGFVETNKMILLK